MILLPACLGKHDLHQYLDIIEFQGSKARKEFGGGNDEKKIGMWEF